MTAPTQPRTVPPVRDGRGLWIGLFGSLLVALAFIIGLSIGGLLGDAGPSTTGLRNDRFSHLVLSGQAQQMLDQHQQMLEQMRTALSPQMLRMMDADPMWKLMRTDEYTKMLEDQQRQIDRMLGRDSQ